tara:strand:+ start:2229 stop:3242 length:1014 start_codon:yes stop_codon:yes gene_type:complete
MKDVSSLKTKIHYPVMLTEVLEICEPQKGGVFLDCTFGVGGYTNALLSFPKTSVIAIDRDANSKKYANIIKKNFKKRFHFYNQKFSELDKAVKNKLKVDFVIFDLGLSSLQISDLKRGFSFKSNDRPNMCMGLNSISGEQVLNNLDLKTLKDIIKHLGEERFAFKIASNIVKQRKQKSINSVTDLVNIIKKSKKRDFNKKINISTKTFQAIRIFVNKEISELIEGLITASKVLNDGGKIIVVTFHSIEDRIVKYFFSNFSSNKSIGSRYFPDISKKNILFNDYNKKIIKPSAREITINKASRSAKIRFAVRSKDKFFYPEEFKKRFVRYLELENKYV